MTHDDTAPSVSADDRGWRRWASTALIGAFGLGLLAVWLIPGNTAEAQNRARLPWPALTAGAAVDTATYRQFDAALRDRMGAQAAASEALGDLSVHVLGRSPSSAVLIGSDHEPFYGEDFARPCRETEKTLAVVKAQLETDRAAMAAASKYVLFIVAPNKSTIRRAAVDDVSPDLLRCSDFVRSHVEAWEAEGGLPLITLRKAVAAVDQKTSAAYLRNDTHRSSTGALTLSDALMQRLVADQQVPASILTDLAHPVFSEPASFVGDLNHMMGVEDVDTATTASFPRPDVVTTGEYTVGVEGTPQLHYTSTSTTSALVPGRTLLIGDSFLMNQIPTQLSNFFEDVTVTDLEEYAQAGEFDRVIVERVERYGATEEWPPLASTLK